MGSDFVTHEREEAGCANCGEFVCLCHVVVSHNQNGTVYEMKVALCRDCLGDFVGTLELAMENTRRLLDAAPTS